MWMLCRSAVERGLIVKVKVSQDTLGSYLFTLAEERLGVLLDQLKEVTGEREGCLGVSATTSETWTWDKWWIDRWLGYSGNQIPEWPEMFTGRLQRGATSISFPVFTARLNVSHRYPAALKESSWIRPLCIISVFGYFLFFPGHSRVKSLNVTNFLWFMIATSLRIASCVDAA